MTTLPAQPGFAGRLLAVASDIKLSHSVFALPFAVLALFLAAAAPAPGSVSGNTLPGWEQVALIVLCMILARTVAMAVNRWADAALDAQNPRTAQRAIPAGRVPAPFMLNVAIFCALGFIAATGGFWVLYDNFWPVALSPVVLVYLAGYSWTKRVTWLCHLYLGVALALSPIAATIAIQPAVLGSPAGVPIWLLSVMVATWVAGFDVLYALQDVAIDRAQGLWSVPSRLGVARALWIARGLHLAAATALAGVALTSDRLGLAFALAAGATVALLAVEHLIVALGGTRRVPLVFLTINGFISLLLGAAGVFDVTMSLRLAA